MHKKHYSSQMTSEGDGTVTVRCAAQVHNFPQWCMNCVRRLRSKPPPWVRIPAGARDFFFFKTFRPGAHPASSLISMGIFSPRESGQDVCSLLTSIYRRDLENGWSYTSTHPTSSGREQKEIRHVKTNRNDRQSQL